MNTTIRSNTTENLTRQANPSRSRALALLLGTDDHVAGPILRLTLGAVMFPHGAQKVLGWFGGSGLTGTYNAMTSMGLPGAIVILVMFVEFVGSLALLTGTLTRAAALGFIAVMAGAIATVHAQNGFFMNWFGQQKGEGFEYHLLVIGIAAVLIVRGAGRFSIDRMLTRNA
jgi:putative oxidoreductase